jgi:hypothetical protein
MGSELWIAGLGHSGTTVCVEILRKCGMDHGNGYEHSSAVNANKKVFEQLYAGESDWSVAWYRKPCEIPLELGQAQIGAIRTGAARMPQVVKDPRWSLTLPWWIRYTYQEHLPRYLWILDRDPHQCAMSWDYSSPHPQTLENVKLRRHQLSMGAEQARARGIRVWKFWYPDFLLYPEMQFLDAIAAAAGCSKGKAQRECDVCIKRKLLHRYVEAETPGHKPTQSPLLEDTHAGSAGTR